MDSNNLPMFPAWVTSSACMLTPAGTPFGEFRGATSRTVVWTPLVRNAPIHCWIPVSEYAYWQCRPSSLWGSVYGWFIGLGGSQSMGFMALRVTVMVVTFCAMCLATRCFGSLRRLFLGVTLRAHCALDAAFWCSRPSAHSTGCPVDRFSIPGKLGIPHLPS